MSAAMLEEMAQPISSSYPTFHQIAVPPDVKLNGVQVTPAQAWRGLICPFETDAVARLVGRVLDADRPLDVHGGYLLPPAESTLLKTLRFEEMMTCMDTVFDVVLLQFGHTVDPWVFSVNPAISRSQALLHPHLRGDREMTFEGHTLTALCIYSAAEFDLSAVDSPMLAFLNQVSIFIGKHVIWDKTKQLITSSGKVISAQNADLYSSIPASTMVSKVPVERAAWFGQWLGRSAVSGFAHLGLDPNGPCWCGDGRLYKDCHRPLEAKAFANTANFRP